MRFHGHHPVAPEGYPFILASLIAASIAYLVYPLSVIPLLGTAGFIVYFFRNPVAKGPRGEGVILAPACGRILFSGEVDEDRRLHRRVKCVSIFMSPLDAHVNRVPASGTVTKVEYNKGRFLTAFHDKASLANEQNALTLENEDGDEIIVVQIAGWFARRIVCYPKAGENLRQGDVFGLIRFGSRVDLYLPLTYALSVRKGDKVSSGNTVLARKMEGSEGL